MTLYKYIFYFYATDLKIGIFGCQLVDRNSKFKMWGLELANASEDKDSVSHAEGSRLFLLRHLPD